MFDQCYTCKKKRRLTWTHVNDRLRKEIFLDAVKGKKGKDVQGLNRNITLTTEREIMGSSPKE